jgi:hypothetical protein
MNFPQFWAKGQSGNFVSWRWSFGSAEEAQKAADDTARQIAQRFERGQFFERHHGYYPGRPFREQIIREFKNGMGELVGLITRNSYGCLVLNTSRVMFVDVDLPERRKTSGGGFLGKLFGKPEIVPKQNPDEAAAIAKAENWARNHPEWGWRIYRTRAGLRLLATHALFDPEAATSNGVFDALGADSLYRQLCKSQKCFRARLTPKPWRCGVRQKPERWPWLTPKVEARFQKWQAQYETASKDWATCELVRAAGTDDVHPDVQMIVQVHDEATRIGSKLTLA